MNKNNLKLSDVIFKNYIRTIEESGILVPFNEVTNYDNEFAEKLGNCKLVAQKEFINCHKEILEIFDSIIKIEKEINNDIIKNKHSNYESIWGDLFREFNFRLTEILTYGSEKIIDSFEEKVKRIDNFSICLFGRTKVGKSTTMEALTKGDGEAIGVGRQNTTLDVKEYYWNHLKVIDTPGIDAMEEIDQLEELALNFADKSDLVAFLMPHQIEEGDFKKFKLFYKQNKPIIIILNIKEHTGSEGTKDMEMFLKNSDKIFETKKIQDYKDRINEYILDSLGIEEGLIPIIPVHSKSAFIANEIKDSTLSEQLYNISNFPNLESLLLKEVTEYGELYRIKNPHETVVLFSNKIKFELSLFSSYLVEQQKVYSKNIKKFTEVKNKIHQKKNDIFKKNIDNYFDNKLSSIGFIVDKLFDTKKEEDRKLIIDNFIQKKQINKQVDKTMTQVQQLIIKELEEYIRQFTKELNLVDLSYKKSKLNFSLNQNITDISNANRNKNTVEGIGVFTGAVGGIVLGVSGTAVLGGAAGTFFGVGAANVWNPLGWGLIGVGIVASVGGYFMSRKRKKKLIQAKIDVNVGLKKEVAQIKTNAIKQINNTITAILKEIKDNHINVLKKYLLFSEKHQYDIERLINDIAEISNNSEKLKYQAMLDNFLNSNAYAISNIIKSDKNIHLLLNSLPPNINDIQKILSRVEGRQIKLIKDII